MKASDLIDIILTIDVDSTNAGILSTSSLPNEDCNKAFGVCNAVIPADECTMYFYEKRPCGCLPLVGIPNAIYMDCDFEFPTIIYMYVIED